MKNLWNLISFMAVANLLALVIFIGWLWRTERLDAQRLRTVRGLFAMTIPEEELQAATAEGERVADGQRAAARDRETNPPLPSAAHIEQVALSERQATHAIRRLQDKTDQHLAQLEYRTREIEARETALAKSQAAWQASIREENDRRVDEQFRKTVSLYESVAGKQAKRMLLQLVADGSIDQAVAYLDAMNGRSATKTIKELKTEEENKLATELLERVRTLGIDVAGRQDTNNAQPSDTLDEPAP